LRETAVRARDGWKIRLRDCWWIAWVLLPACKDSVAPTELAGPPEGCKPGIVQEAIIGGSANARLFPLTSDEERAIVALSLTFSESGESALCSGVVVGERAVLTARHCLDLDDDGVWDERAPESAVSALVVLGSPEDPDAPKGPVDEVWLHPELDVAVLEVSWLAEPSLGVTPIAMNPADMDETWIGAPVEIAGFGETEFVEPAALRFAIEAVARVESSQVVVDGMGRTGACVGDSGGALLGRADDARILLFGVLDDGDRSCVGEDFYTRADVLKGWEPLARLLPDDEPGDIPCVGLSERGSCERGRAMYCEGGRAQVDACVADGRACGWSSADEGFRCVPPEEDPCEGLGSYSHCFGDMLVSCVEGTPTTSDCQTCSEACVPWADGSGAACHAVHKR
jgi:hypothetical protein